MAQSASLCAFALGQRAPGWSVSGYTRPAVHSIAFIHSRSVGTSAFYSVNQVASTSLTTCQHSLTSLTTYFNIWLAPC